ncbi:MAG: tRNA uridine-5-carboxymethylaminomethyl(34) synthesis GTPase MnmE [Desulfuromonas sp.]|nr:MAG: tRNA uridine-5-carboxymethylaminomethyl(34) synthesis GTPase MnmE [Desulfuromonas sp.]
MFSSTIVAPVTPPGEGGVCILRLSGPESLDILEQVFSGQVAAREMLPRRLYLGSLHDLTGQVIDHVFSVHMPAPHSYTGEHVVELHCHGGSLIRRLVIDLLLSCGARMASPGEFTQRAFLNGKLDLTQAESVANLIGARSLRASQQALGQLEGKLSRRIHFFADVLKRMLVEIEACIDFPDDEVEIVDRVNILERSMSLKHQMSDLLNSFDTGRILREGLSLLIVGRPNVGKSSLLNSLLGEQRAIVTDIPGTTRDTIEESIEFAGFPVRLIDTAGVRHTNDPVERLGVERTKSQLALSDLILLVVDASQPVHEDDCLAAKLCPPDKTLLILNKSDLPFSFQVNDLGKFSLQVEVSAKYGLHLDALQSAVKSFFDGDGSSVGSGEDLMINDRRHYDALLASRRSLQSFTESLSRPEVPLECLAFDLRSCLDGLGVITGETTPDDILTQIFSRFCIGK